MKIKKVQDKYVKKYLDKNLEKHIKTGLENFMKDPSDDEVPPQKDNPYLVVDLETDHVEDKKQKKMMKVKKLGKNLMAKIGFKFKNRKQV